MIKSYRDLEVYERSFDLAMDIFHLAKSFPKVEDYSLTSQIIRSSRSISANICEGWAKRKYENIFKQHLIHAMGSCSETEMWLSFALACDYIKEDTYAQHNDELAVIGKMLNTLHQNWKNYGG